jgi:hypothetical protein
VATTDAFPPTTGPEVALHDEVSGLSWTVRFFDPVVLPELGLLTDDGPAAAAAVCRVLGVGAVVYHLSLSAGGGLTPHHAQHAGTGLANSHASAARDFETLYAALPDRADLVGELAVAERVGLTHATALLAEQILPNDPTVRAAAAAALASSDEAPADGVRRALLTAVRGSRPSSGEGIADGR